MKWIIHKKQGGMLIRDYLRIEHAFSRRIIKAIKFEGGEIRVNGEIKKVNEPLAEGDELSIRFPIEKKAAYMNPAAIPLDIVYEDEAILVINKQAGIATIPSLNQNELTIANGVLAYYEQKNIPYTIHIVTRLDRNTSGLLLIAKHRYAHSLLSNSQIAGHIHRKYRAIAEGVLQSKSGSIRTKIGRKEGSIIEREVREDGKEAATNYTVIAEKDTHSLLDIVLETGRTHQIRVHFSSIGHPLAGDDLYGGSTLRIKRQALHCRELAFEHPFTKKELTFQAAMPTDMEALLKNSP
ncbi:RluA family pseudouridine synthase [Virgibacillus sp. LDC-1]|uniref:RluA family pseudouridine synthase n=1 Tax=Virgibacillus sp. LDC-1 TaxID=3039856 RepID=UPI0024DEBE09|nr:RluA family pseudouridine synthase [Virgibacillus sp. LDC-1]